MWKLCLNIIIIILLLITLLCVGIAFFLFRFACKRVKDKQTNAKKKLAEAAPSPHAPIIQAGLAYMNTQPYETVEIPTEDGLMLRGRFYPALTEAKRTILCVHGFYSYGLHDFGGVGDFYLPNACNMLIMDHRAHGSSEGKYRTFGVKESKDVLTWAQWASQKAPGLPIYLDGISMGCSSVLMAASLPLPKEVVGIIADCGYTSPKEIFTHVLKLWFHLPAFPILPIAGIFCKIIAGFSIYEDTRKHIPHCTLPILFLHGADDHFVPTVMSQQNYQVCTSPYKSIKITEGAAHGESYLMDKEGCQTHIKEFWRLCERLQNENQYIV
ncbi:MAG: alpha/beta hydrolase [Clostridia bacterium]|nr:alpha/beta hydrolase [Clostridia bacterium]